VSTVPGVRRLKVLHLAPPAVKPDALTAHSFIDEEILALREAGIDCQVLSDTGTASVRHGVSVSAPASLTLPHKLRRLLSFSRRNARALPVMALRHPRQLAHALRVEEAAADLIRREGIDLVHSHFGWPGGFGGVLAAASAGVPLVAALRGMDVLVNEEIGYGLRRDAGYRSSLDVLLTHAQRTLYATEFLRRIALGLGSPADRAVVVRKGVDLSRFRPAADRAAEQTALGLGGPVILGVGILGPRKGYHHLLDALGGLRQMPWTLALCGEGAHRDALEAQAGRLGIADRVRFLGWVPREAIGRYFAAADIFVHTALVEAAGNVILEAQAAGCATVTSDSGGPPEYIVAGETGLIVPPENPDALRAALQTLLEDVDLRARLGMAARHAAETRFSYARMIADLIAVYRDVMETSRPDGITSV
jgi:glycosyltransferase involved in cell wall biosynthesis